MRFAAALAALAAAMALPALAQTAPSPDGGTLPPPVPIEEWPLDKVSRIGLEMYRLDSAAWLATDALIEAISEEELRSVRGWLVEPGGEGLRVHFYRQGEPDPVPGWQTLINDDRAGPVTPAQESALTAGELAQTRALATARANVGPLRCSPNVNTVIMGDPDSDDWLVWLLTPMPENGAVPIGGHYRFRISADGRSVLRRDQLSNGCFFADPPPADVQDSMLFYTQIVSKGPVETHVFLSIQNRLPIIVAADDRFFAVGGAQIAEVTDTVAGK